MKHSRQPGIGWESDADAAPKKKKRAAPRRQSNNKSGKRSELTTEKTMRRPRLIVGIDFGTTYTGVAFVMSGNTDLRDVRVVCDWSGGLRRNEELEKVPSCIAYAAENEDLTDDCFGYNVEPSMKSYHWTKLLLDESTQAAPFNNPDLKSHHGLLKLPKDKTAVEVAADILRFVHDHTMEKLRRIYGEETVKATKIDCWLTVPAMWTENGRYRTKKAASMAGFGSGNVGELNIITEPEAAAIASLCESLARNPNLYKEGDTVLICDMGGGTIDVQSHTIKQLEPVKTEEVCASEGCRAGSTYIDNNLLSWMENKFGEAYKLLPDNKIAANSKFMASWEILKKSFDVNDQSRTYRLSLPGLRKCLEKAQIFSSAYDPDDHEVLITGLEIMQLFDPIIHETCKLILCQQTKLSKKSEQRSFKTIILCGGLGESDYVWTKLQEFCRNTLNGEVSLMIDARAWSAIARGAAIRGLDGSHVVATCSNRHYGIGVHQPFREGIDAEQDAFECPIRGKRAGGYIDWSITKGRKITPRLRVPSKVYVTIGPDQDDWTYIWTLYSCNLDTAPNRVGNATEVVGVLTLDLSEAFEDPTQPQLPHGKVVAANINVVFKVGCVKGLLIVQGLYGNEVVGTAHIDYSTTQAARLA